MKVVFGMCLMVMSFLASANLTISDASVRLLPPTVPNTSAYFSIHNSGGQDRTIVAAKSAISPRVELHQHIMTDEMMSMQQVENVVVAAGETVTFAPGGLHLMLFGLNRTLTEDEEIAFIIEMKNGEKVEFNAVVKPPAAHKHHH